MNKTVGFLLESAASIPSSQIFRAALRHRVFIVDANDKKLCSIHERILQELNKDEWKNSKYPILDNLFYFLDKRRTEQCNLIARADK